MQDVELFVFKIIVKVNSEFYTGWLDWWGSPHSTVSTEKILKSFFQIMQLGGNVNFYMFFGGTNFGFSNGANQPYMVQLTTYDYDAPISEPGDITDKYMAIRSAISKYLPLPQVPIPANSTKVAYGRVQMAYVSIFNLFIKSLRVYFSRIFNFFDSMYRWLKRSLI